MSAFRVSGEKPAMLVVDILDLVMTFKSKFVMLAVCSIFGMSGEKPMLAIDILNLLVKARSNHFCWGCGP